MNKFLKSIVVVLCCFSARLVIAKFSDNAVKNVAKSLIFNQNNDFESKSSNEQMVFGPIQKMMFTPELTQSLMSDGYPIARYTFDVQYFDKTENKMVGAEGEGFDLRQKIFVIGKLAKEGVMQVTVVRLDSGLEESPTMGEVRSTYDTLWQDICGWNGHLLVRLNGGEGEVLVKEFWIPANPQHDVMQFNIDAVGFTVRIPSQLEVPKYIHQVHTEESLRKYEKWIYKTQMIMQILNPSWTFNLISENTIGEYYQIVEGRKLKKFWDNIESASDRLDLYIQTVMHHNGGCFLPSGALLLRPFDSFLIVEGNSLAMVGDQLKTDLFCIKQQDALTRNTANKLQQNYHSRLNKLYNLKTSNQQAMREQLIKSQGFKSEIVHPYYPIMDISGSTSVVNRFDPEKSSQQVILLFNMQ